MRKLFDYQWVHADPYPERSVQHTMARLRVEAGGHVLTRFRDRHTNESDSSIVTPLIRIAEWAVAHWWRLWYEAPVVSGDQHPGYAQAHDLRHAGNGFVLPRIVLAPFGPVIHVEANPWQTRYADVDFVGEGRASLRRADLQADFASLIDDVILRLQEKRAPETSLEGDWETISNLDEEQAEFCQAAGMAGLDPFDLSDSLADAIERLWNETHPGLREDALHAADGASVSGVARWLPRQLMAVEEIGSGSAWKGIRRSTRSSVRGEDPPWKRGYAAGQAVLEELDIPLGSPALEHNGSLKIGRREVASPSPRIEGCVASDAPSCVVARGRAEARRFLIARAIGDYLTRAGPGPCILGTRNAPRQAETRAFAAEFLAPSAWLRGKVGATASVDQRAVDELAVEAKVSSWVIYHQLRNHGIAQIADPLWPASPSWKIATHGAGWSPSAMPELDPGPRGS